MEQRVGVVAGAAAGIKHHRPVQRYGRVGEAPDEDLGAHRLPGLVVVAGFARVVLVAAQFGPPPQFIFFSQEYIDSVNSLRAKFVEFSFRNRSIIRNSPSLGSNERAKAPEEVPFRCFDGHRLTIGRPSTIYQTVSLERLFDKSRGWSMTYAPTHEKELRDRSQ